MAIPQFGDSCRDAKGDDQVIWPYAGLHGKKILFYVRAFGK